MATPAQTSALPQTNQLEQLATHLEQAQLMYGSAKNYARMAIENPAQAARANQAAAKLTAALRIIQTLG